MHSIGRGLVCAAQAFASALVLYVLFIIRPVLPSHAGGNARPGTSGQPGRFSGQTEETAPAHDGAPDGRIVVFIHPALQNAASWYFHSRALRGAGHTLYFFEYSCREASLDRTGRRLAAVLDGIGRQAPGRKVILLGASMGGLVCRAALPHMRRQDCMAGLITLACPHKGSRLASLVPRALFPLLASITHNGPAIRALEAREAERPAPPASRTAFFSDGDELVLPHDALHPPQKGGWREIPSGTFSHMAIMLHPRVIRAVVREIGAIPA